MNKIQIPGFQFAGIHCGIKDNPRKKDLTLIYSEEPETQVAGVFTKNRVVAAPVLVCRDVVKKGRGRLIVINSGVANACTGAQGLADSKRTQSEAAQLFKLPTSSVLVCSTGKIGDLLPMNKLIKGIGQARGKLSANHFLQAARGIMTTDQYPKYAAVTGKIGGKPYTIAVLAKGAGMLRPDMATMLCYILTDLNFAKPVLRKIFKAAVDVTLNRITVDGDMSTNDTVLMLANGWAQNPTFTAESREGKMVQAQLTDLLENMAQKIALDGEGATKVCRVIVTGARNDADAKKIAYAIGNSPLVKTALFGCDPNWGRIMAAVGYSGASIIPEKVSIKMGSTLLVRGGRGVSFSPAKVSKYLHNTHVTMHVDCGLAKGSYHVFMSDLTYDYIHLNAEYHT